MSTRPFLTPIEKKWITFQVLCALHQCHKQKIFHGDIKLENILVTSWNWILLSDFASFKPTYLPEDNPADYSYFFDTSRRRTCYIAPERFVKSFTSDNKDNPLPFSDGSYYHGNLLPEMDIFSAGCALLELWTEGTGTAPFEFSQLLTYRNGDNELVSKHLNSIEDINLRNLLSSMLSVNPKNRKGAEIYLDMERGRLFPEYFYSFLQSYIPILFSTIPIVPSDDKIMRLHSDITQIIENEVITSKSKQEDDGLILITALVTSCIRGLKYCNSKLHCLEILHKIAENTSSETILDRILPYILHMCQDISANVRVAALNTLTQCLCLVENLPRSDANIFPEYILPSIAHLAIDPATIVRVAYAQNIATLAETSVRFLEQTQLSNSDSGPIPNYENELHDLQEMLANAVMSLLTDTQAVVKQTLMEAGITKLCVFFGSQKANDIILSHIITFLNDKDDKNLRGTFFDCIVGIATYVGWHSSPILIPLLQQGFSDPEEFVIAKAIRATTALAELGLLQKISLVEFISECACFLNHPNLWIRHEICGLISISAKILSPIDVQCKIMPHVTPHLKTPLIQIERTELLLDCLNPSIPRSVYDMVLKFPEISQLMEVLKERKSARSKAGANGIPKYGEMSQSMRTVSEKIEKFKKLIIIFNFYMNAVLPTSRNDRWHV
jgi:phosphoinositide-3-kinase regulatory subunit 4